MSAQSEETKKQWGITGVAVPAGLFIGMGVGWVFGYMVQGLFIGLGVGFLIFGLVMAIKRD